MHATDRIGWGVLGCGRMAERRIGPAFADSGHSTLIAFCSRDLARATEFQHRFGAKSAYDNIYSLCMDDRIQAIYIGTPNALHAEQAGRILAAGKHVLVDKPMALTTADAFQMREASRQASRTLGVLHQQRFHPANQALIKLVRAGVPGRLLNTRMQIAMWYPTTGVWRGDKATSGGGAAMDLGPHALDLLLQLAGMPSRVDARLHQLASTSGVEDHCVAHFEYENEMIAQIELSYAARYYGGRIEVYGDQGTVIIDGSLQQAAEYTTLIRRGDQPDPIATTKATHNCYRAAIDDFSLAILTQRPPAVTAEDGLATVRLLESIYESGERQRPVEL